MVKAVQKINPKIAATKTRAKLTASEICDFENRYDFDCLKSSNSAIKKIGDCLIIEQRFGQAAHAENPEYYRWVQGQCKSEWRYELLHRGLNIYANMAGQHIVGSGTKGYATRLIAMPLSALDPKGAQRLEKFADSALADNETSSKGSMIFDQHLAQQPLVLRDGTQMRVIMNFLTDIVTISGSVHNYSYDKNIIHLSDLDAQGQAYFNDMRKMARHYQEKLNRPSPIPF